MTRSFKYPPDKKVINQKDAKLLLMSRIIDSHPWLREILEEDGCLNGRHYHELDEDKKRILDRTYQSMRTQAIREWIRLNKIDVATDQAQLCTLCGKKGIKWKCYIKNRVTNSDEIVVGSECVKHFDFGFEGVPLGQLIKDKEKLLRRQALGNEFDGLDERLAGARSFLSTTAVMVPRRLETPYLAALNELQKAYDFYLDGKFKSKNKKDAINLLFDRWNVFLEKRNEIEGFVKGKLGHPFAVTRAIVRHLQALGEINTIELLKDNDLITVLTLHRISEANFMKSLVPRWNKILEQIGVKVLRADPDHARYVIQFGKRPGILFTVTHRALAEAYSTMLYGEEPIEDLSTDHFIKKCSLYGSDEVIRILLPRIRRLGYTPVSHRTHDTSIAFRDPEGGYVLADQQQLANELIDVALESEMDPDGKVQEVLGSLRRYTPEQFRTLQEAMSDFGQTPARRRSG